MFEKIFISFVDKYSLQLWEENIEILNIPVDLILIETFLRILAWRGVLNSRISLLSFHTIEHITCILKSLIDIFGEIKSGFVLKSLPGNFIEMWTKEIGFSSKFFRFFQSIFYLKTWFVETPAFWNSEMKSEHIHVGPESEVKPIVSLGVPHVEVLSGRVFV